MIRNKEFRQFAILFIILATMATIIGFIISVATGMLVVSFSVVLGITIFLFTNARYKAIARMSAQIDLVMHDADRLEIDELDEGELSILQSEITKMTLRIREQNEALKKEKHHLADSLADIAHQLRTPLTSISLILSLLANNPEERERKALLREAEELLVRMDWLLTSLLKLARLDAGVVVFQREKVDVSQLINTALQPLQIPMELHGIDVQRDVPDGVEILGDPGWLSEAIQNILKNCMESVGENGTVKIACTDNPLYTEIAIHDSGPGFEREDLQHVFERFYQGESASATGYGIGLALCKTIITRQGGAVTAKNHPQGGAVFAIRFSK